MSNIQIDTTIQDNAIKSNYDVNHKLTPIALPHSDSDHDESSNNSKKSRRFILNNMQSTSPKLKSSYDTNKLTIKEQISLYQSLSNTDKNNFLIKNYSENPNGLYDMYLNMPINDANAFLTKASVVLSNQIIQNYENLPNDDKQIVNSAAHKMIASMINSMPKDKKDEFTSKFNKALKSFPMPGPMPSPMPGPCPGPSEPVDPAYNGNITPHAIPIMALIVKAFVGNMNTESLDELEQILKADMVNKFLDSVKNQINDDIQKYKDLEKTASTQSKGMKIFQTILLVVTIVVMVAIIVFTAGAGIADLMGLGSELGETGAGVVGDAGEAGEAGEAADVDPDMIQPDDPSMMNPMENEPEMDSTGKADSEAFKSNASNKTALQNGEKLEEAEGGKPTPKDDPKSIKNWSRKNFMKSFNNEKNSLGRLWKNVKPVASRMVKAAGLLGGAYGVGYMVNSTYGKNGQVKQQAQLGEYQSDVQASTVQSDTLNNAEQTDSKRIDDDSQRISQSAGYCQQAINMLAQAMSMRA